jgi:hypothetical protein
LEGVAAGIGLLPDSGLVGIVFEKCGSDNCWLGNEVAGKGLKGLQLHPE